MLTTRNRVIALGYVYANQIPEGATVLVANVEGVPRFTFFDHPTGNRGWIASTGWNGSYHEADYSPRLLAWAKGPGALRRARRMLRAARAALTLAFTDAAQARLVARAHVRPGD